MLSIGPMAGGQGRYYLELAREDYYLSGGEPVGRWWGKGAEHFGLAGEKVTQHTLKSFLAGVSPAGEPLVQNADGSQHQSRRSGFDLTFSAPKTVSALWAVAPEQDRRDIQACQDAAVKAALGYLEEVAGFTRTGKAGVHLHKATLAVALFEHGTSRAMDPQLHTHALLMNFGVMKDGRTRALVHTEFFEHKMVAGALYRAELAAQLERRLGLAIAPDEHAYKRGGLGFKVLGVPEALCDFWSKRREAIEKVLGEKGLESAVAAAIAAKDTREVKDIVPPRAELFERWRGEARDLGVSVDREKAFAGRPARDADQTFAAALAKTLREMTAAPESRREAKTVGGRVVQGIVDALRNEEPERAFALGHFGESLLLRRLAENCQGTGLDIATLLDKFRDAVEHSPDIVRLGKSKNGEHVLTTREVMELERETLRTVGELDQDRSHGINSEVVSRAVAAHDWLHSDKELGPEREAAVRYLAGMGGGGVRCLEGWAGVAKTTTLELVRKIYEDAGYQVIGTAVAGKAVEELRNSGGGPTLEEKIVHHAKQVVRQYFKWRTTDEVKTEAGFKEACTLRMFEKLTGPNAAAAVKHHAKQLWRAARGKDTFKFDPIRLDAKTVVVCDEASMVDTRQMAMLVDRVKRAGALLILSGDRGQLQAVGLGGAFSHIADKFGKVDIHDIVRQRDPVDRAAVKDAALGRAAPLLKSFADRGLLNVERDRRQATDRLVKDWMKFEGGKRKAESLIFAGTNEDVNAVNRQCQKARLDAGELTAIARTSLRGQTFYRGDRVLFRANDYSIGVNNGETGTIVAVNPTPILKTLTVKLDNGRKVVVPLRDYKDVSLGYAVTTHKGQGSTVERAYVLLGGGMQDKELSYVQVSRARAETRLYAAEAEAGAANKGLVKQMERSNAKTLAHTAAIDMGERERVLTQELGG